MNTLLKHSVVLTILFTLTVTGIYADDLNPPDFRGDPLSVYAHWQQIPGAVPLQLTGYNWVDDADPDTTLFASNPPDIIDPTDNTYEFHLPNFIDKMPVKYMRLQLTWNFVDLPPTVIGLTGTEGSDTVFGNIVFTSPVSVVDPTGALFYQYYDIEFYPNPDQERWLVQVPNNAFLVQAVVDTVSTIPEPATLLLMGIGGLALGRKRK